MAGRGPPLRLGGPDLAAARLASGPWSWLGAVLSCGFLTAAAGTTVGHELGWGFTAGWMGLAFLLGGWRAVGFFVAAGLWGKAVLEIINFIEHYGLVRVPGTRVEPRHSWNSNAWMSITTQRPPRRRRQALLAPAPPA
ncbi:MAG: hypothetical protein IPO28_07155 [Holophagaceae bacterium]|nr:hypothetical protein [Holophagaceae bacterium]